MKLDNSRIKSAEEALANADTILCRIRTDLAAEAIDRQEHPIATLYDSARESSILDVAGAMMSRLRPPGDDFPYSGLQSLLENADANALVEAFRRTSRFLSRAHRQEYDEGLRDEHAKLLNVLKDLKFDGFAEPTERLGFVQSVACLFECVRCVHSGHIHAAEDEYMEAVKGFVGACEKLAQKG